MAIRLIIDSASDIQPQEAAELGLIHVPLTVRFGDTEYRDAIDLSHAEFYEKLAGSAQLPVTSQVAPSAFEEVLKPIVAAGDTAIIITLSSALSGTCQSAHIAADAVGGEVYVVDTLNVCIGERILIQRAVELRDAGADAKSIVEVLEREKGQVRLVASLDTLEYLKKGGRISGAVAFAGTLLNIKPVITVDAEGKVAMAGKARGSKNVNNLLRELVKKGGGIDFSRPFALAYSGNSEETLNRYIADCADLYVGKAEKLPVSTVGCVIGTHVGPGAVAVAYFEK